MGKVFKRITASIIGISIMFNSGLAEIISYAETIDMNKIYQVAKSAISDFEIEEGVLIKYKGKKEVVEIPDEVTIIGKEAFKNNKTIKEVNISKSVTSIEDSAFKGCENLEKVSLKEGLFKIGNNAFENCKSMKMIIIPEETSILGDEIFKNCKSLKGISLPKHLYQIGDGAFQGCENIETITIPNDISSIEKDTFKDCKSLKNVIILNKEFSISSEMFENIDDIKFYGQKNSLVEQISKEKKYNFEEIILIEKVDVKNSLSINEKDTVKLDLTIEPKNANEPIYIIADDEIVEVTDKNSIKALKSRSTEISVFTSQSEVKTVDVDVNKSSKISKDNTTSRGVNTRSSESDLTYKDYTYTVYNGEVTITGYNGSATDITIPSSINNMPVTSIGDSAFSYCISLNSIEIPDGVTSIGNSAFYYSNSLSSIKIPNSVTSIGGFAFSSCSSLSSIEIPNSVTSIGDFAFSSCSSLSSIEIPNSVTSIGERAFSSCSSLSSIEIPNSVTSIEYGLFEDCSSLSSVEIPNSVTSIEHSAFYSCKKLININVDDNNKYYKSIDGVLYSKNGEILLLCPRGKSIIAEFSKSVTSIGDFAFGYCSSLSSIEIPYGVTSIGNSAFSGCNSLSSINIPNSVTSIGSDAFAYCSSLSSIQIPDGVTSIGSRAFFYCISLSSIEIPNGVTSIEYELFRNCSSLSSVELSKSVTSIGSDAFAYCSNLSSIEIPNSVTSIGRYAFAYCSNLSSIEIPNSVTSIDVTSFYVCKKLININVDDNNKYYKSIDGVLYSKNGEQLLLCPNGKSTITKFSENVTIIGEHAFVRSSSLSSITFPSSVTIIGRYAFGYCSSLSSIYIPSSVTTISSDAFVGIDKFTIYGIEGSFAQQYASSNYKCKFEAIDASYFEEYFKEKETFLEFKSKNITMGLNSNDTVLLRFESDFINYNDIKCSASDESIVKKVETGEFVPENSLNPYTPFIKVNITSGDKEGKCTITATRSDGKTATCTVEVINSDYVEFKYASGNKRDYNGKCYYSDTYFYESSYGDNSKELSGYNPSLATASLCLAMSAFNSNYDGEGDDKYKNKSENVKNLLKELGFNKDKDVYINDFYKKKPTIDSIGVAIADRKLKVEDKDYTLIAVAVRGGGYESEWAGNFTLGELGNHQGFSKARDEVLESLRKYIEKNNITGNVKIWITGYSRGAAAANMTAGALVNTGKIGNINLERKDIYAYCFETPMGVDLYLLFYEKQMLAGRDDTVSGLEYNNIFNIINKNDPVTKVAMSDLRFNRYGVNYNLPVKGVTVDYETKKDKMLDFFCRMDSYSELGKYTIDDFKMQTQVKEHSLLEGNSPFKDDTNNNCTQGLYLDTLVSNLTAQSIKSRSNYVDKLQNPITNILREIFGNTKKEDLIDKFVKSLLDKLVEPDNLCRILDILSDPYVPDEVLKSVIYSIVKSVMGDSDNNIDINRFADDLAVLIKEFLQDNFDDVITGIVNVSSLAQAHYPELCLAWLMSMDKNYVGDTIVHYGCGSYRILSINCPIDIDVYDSNNNLVGSIKDNVPQEIQSKNSVVTSFNEDGEKIIYLPIDESYTLKLSATEDGEMNYSINEYSDLEQDITRAVNYQQIKIKKGDKFTAHVPAYKSSEAGNNIEYSSTNYILTNPSGTTLKANQDIKGEVPKYMVTLETNSTEYGNVYGQGVHEVGRFAEVQAVAQEGYNFVGWYEGDKLLSEDKEYRFCVEKDITLVAHFDKESDTPVINPGKPGGGGGGTSTPTQPSITENKLVGEDRYKTAIKVSNEGWTKADNVIIVNSSAIVDALSATPFAKLKDAPILLTEQNKLNSETKKEILRLKAKNIYVIGGESVVSNSVINELKSMNLNVERISGDDRYKTSLEIAKRLGNVSEIAVVNGVTGLPDVVSIAPVSADKKIPIVLSSPNEGTKIFDEFIKNNNIKTSYVIGREKAISDEIESKLPNPQRLGGEDRNETNAIILEKFYTSKTLNNIFVAKDGMNKADDLIDALAVGVLASKEKSPVVIVGKNLNSKQESLLSKKQPKEITQVGGNGNENAFNKLVNLFK